MSIERLGNVLPKSDEERLATGNGVAPEAIPVRVASVEGSVVIPIEGDVDPEAEAKAFLRFCYRRRAVAWPELYDEMCAVAAQGHYRGMDYEELRGLGIGFALAALPRLAELTAHVIAEERRRHQVAAIA